MGKFTEPVAGPFSIASLVILIGGLIGIIAVFLNWFDWTESTILGKFSITYNGFDFAFSDDFKNVDDFQRYCPFIAWLLILLAFVAALLPVFNVKVIDEKITYIIVAVFGLLALIFVIMFMTWNDVNDHLAIGVYLGLISAILVMVGGALPVVEQFTK